MTDRVVLAYSGGLDTSVAIPWIAEDPGAEVIAVAVDVGQGGEDMEVIRQRALGCGAVESIVLDAREVIMEELIHKGVCGRLLSWIRDYLYDRKAQVVFQGATSTEVF